MVSEWPIVRLGDVTRRITKGTTPTSVGGRFTDEGIAFVKVESIDDEGRLLRSKVAYIDERSDALLSRSRLEADDVLFTIAGTIGRVAIVGPSVLPANTNQAVAIIRPDNKVVAPRFLYYALRDKPRVAKARTRVVQSVQANFSLKELSLVEVPLPTRDEQHRIADLLGALDDKIELNRRMSETLEWMAGSLFDRWFVDGDDLPNNMGDAVPAIDWAVRPLDSIADFLNGAACQKYPALDGEPSLPVIKIRELTQGITSQSDRVTKLIPEKWHVHNGDVLFSWSGTLLTRVWTGGPAALNQHLFKVTSPEHPKWFYLRWVLHHLGDFRGVAAAKATTMGHIKRHHLSDATCLVPPAASLEAMTTLMEPMLDRQIACENESSTLAAIRDALLPKLISGELRIPDAEQLVSEVTSWRS